jgi:hypothetical protein
MMVVAGKIWVTSLKGCGGEAAPTPIDSVGEECGMGQKW